MNNQSTNQRSLIKEVAKYFAKIPHNKKEDADELLLANLIHEFNSRDIITTDESVKLFNQCSNIVLATYYTNYMDEYVELLAIISKFFSDLLEVEDIDNPQIVSNLESKLVDFDTNYCLPTEVKIELYRNIFLILSLIRKL